MKGISQLNEWSWLEVDLVYEEGKRDDGGVVEEEGEDVSEEGKKLGV